MKKQILILTLCLSLFFATPILFAADDCAFTGKMVYMQLSAIRDIGPVITGEILQTPTIALYIRDKDWEAVSADDRADLQCYMPILVNTVLAAPENYLDTRPSAPIYQRAINNVRNNTPINSWVIYTGRLLQNGEVGFDQVVVSGR